MSNQPTIAEVIVVAAGDEFRADSAEQDKETRSFCVAALSHRDPGRLDGFANIVKQLSDDGGHMAPSEIRVTYGFGSTDRGRHAETAEGHRSIHDSDEDFRKLEEKFSVHLVLWENPPESYEGQTFPLIGFQMSPFWKLRQMGRARPLLPAFEPVVYEAGTTTSMVADQIFAKLGVDSLESPLSLMVREEEVLASGASFRVSLVRTRQDSSFPDAAGDPKRQWKRNDIIAVKRPLQLVDFWAGSTRNKDQVQRSFVNEIRILSHPPLRNHRHLIYLFGVAWDEEAFQGTGAESIPKPVLLQEYARYGSLDKYLLSNQTSWSTKTDLACQVLYGLQALHSCYILHGDVKCENILLSKDTSTSRLVAKLSDFGFSTILVDYKPNDMAEILGGTERFMAPEILQAMEAHNALIPVSVALKADLYSFGLAVCTIALSGRDFFDGLKEAVLDPNDIQVPDSEALSVLCKTIPVMGAVMCTFARDITTEMRSYGEVEVNIGPAIVKILRQNHEMRPSSAASVFEALGIPDTEPETSFASNSTAKPTDQNESMPELDLEPNLASLERGPTRFLVGNDQLFFMNEKLYSVGISESKVHTSMLRLPYSRRWQTFNNLVSNFESIDAELRSMSAPGVTLQTVQKHARCAFLAYQIFKCYSLGCGTLTDLDKAHDYLRRSAELGYVQAMALMHMIKFRDPQSHETSIPEGIPSAIYAMASYGPRFGDHAWPLEMGILRETSPQNYSRVLCQMALYGIPEFSEIIDDDVDPDVENTLNYQYAKLGSMSLAMRMIPLLSAAEFKNCLAEKIFPCGQTNRHHETLLYMCCRNTDADKAMMLLDTYEWARDQVSTANANGRTPLHWLWLMSPEDVRRVGDALIGHGANTDSGDRFEQRPIDIALKAQRRDVVDYFLEHMTDPFHIVGNLQLNVRIMWNLMAYDDIGLFESYLLQKAEADLITDISFFQNVFVDNLDSRMAQLGSRRQSRLEFIFRTLKRRFGREAAYQAVLEQLCPPLLFTGDHDVIDAILETRALDHVLPGNSGKAILFWASRLSAFEIFLKFLCIYQDWEIADAHEVLGLAIQNPGPRQCDIIVSLVDHLDKLDLARAAVNYRVPDSCQSGCTTDHSHYFYGSQYWNAIDEGAYEIADYLEPYCDQPDGLPSTIYHILNKPGKDVVNHLEYVLRAPDRHRAYVCRPLIQANVLHVAIGSADAYTSLSQLQTVLEMLLEFYIEYLGENIDSTDSGGYTALAYAACTRLSDVVQLLLRWKADPTRTLGNPCSRQITTAFDHAARQFIVDVENMPAGTGRVTFFHGTTSHPLREADAEHRHHPERMISVLGLLSRPWGRFPPSLISDDVFEPAAEVRGLVPLTYTRNVKFMPSTWKGSAQATGLYAWGHLATPHLEYWINLLVRSEVSDDELAGIRADLFKKRQGETKWHFSIGEYFCRLIRVDHRDEGENSEQEEDLAKRGISVMSDGEVIDDRIDGARIIGDRVVFSSRATDERSGTIVAEERVGVSGKEDDRG